MKRRAASVTGGLIGALAFVEITSGILQGYYVPLTSDIVTFLGLSSDADFNTFEGTQLLLSALVVPILAKLGDMFGHKKILLVSTVLTAIASWALVFSVGPIAFGIAWTFQGFYTVWLPLEIALIFDKGRKSGSAAATTRSAAAYLVVALEAGAIVGALVAGRAFAAFGGNENIVGAMPATLAIPAVAVTLAFFAILLFVKESTPLPGRRLDAFGFSLLALSLLSVTSALTFLKVNPLNTWWIWALLAVGVALLWPFVRHCLRVDDPAIDIRVLRQPTMWPVQLTAFLVGISLLGAQAPLSTFAGTDPETAGFGLGLSATSRSLLIGGYLISLIIGAVLFPRISRLSTPRRALIQAAALVALGYGVLIFWHVDVIAVITCMVVAGIGAGMLMGAMPSAAAAAAPVGQTGIASAMTNTTKTLGGSFASSVFAIVLPIGAVQVAGSTAAGQLGYQIVWAICAMGALVAVALLYVVPKEAFTDKAPVDAGGGSLSDSSR